MRWEFYTTGSLGSGLLLLALVEGDERDTRDLDDLEADTWNISDGVSGTTESSNENLVLLFCCFVCELQRTEKKRRRRGALDDQKCSCLMHKREKKGIEREGVATNVILNEGEATVTGDESGDLLSVLDELNTDALADSRVRLLGLNTELLKDDSLGVGGSREGVGLPDRSKVSLLVFLVGPTLLTATVLQLAGSADSSRLTANMDESKKKKQQEQGQKKRRRR